MAGVGNCMHQSDILDWQKIEWCGHSRGKVSGLNRCLDIVRCGVVSCEPGWSLDEAWSTGLHDHDLWYCWAGRGEMHLSGGRRVAIGPGTCIWMRPGGRYVATQSDRDRLGVTFIHFEPSLSSIGTRWPNPVPEHFVAPNLAFMDAALRRVVGLIGATPARSGTQQSRGGDGTSRSRAAALLAWVLDDLNAHGRPSPDHGTDRHHREVVHAAAARLREAVGDGGADGVRVGELAAQAGYSADHFTRLFKAEFGLTPGRYAVRHRLDRAAVLLTESSLPVAAIASTLGYRSPFFFSRQFKSHRGVSPSDYRRHRR